MSLVTSTTGALATNFAGNNPWTAMTAIVAESVDATRTEYERVDTAFQGYQEVSARIIRQLEEQNRQLQAEIATIQSHTLALKSRDDARVAASTTRLSALTQLLEQLKLDNLNLEAEVAKVTAENSTIQGTITHLKSPAGQDAAWFEKCKLINW